MILVYIYRIDIVIQFVQIELMEMYGKRYLFGAALIFSLAIFITIFRASSSLSTIFFYFWPLLLSTSTVLVGMIVIGRISPPINYSGDTRGEALFDYVAGQPAKIDAHGDRN